MLFDLHLRFARACARKGLRSSETDNAFCESFNNRVRQELLNPNWFRSLADARVQASAWRRDYNANHPHSSLGNLSPEEYALRAKNNTQTAAISGEVVA